MRDGRCWSHVLVHKSRRCVGDGVVSRILASRSWCCMRDGRYWEPRFRSQEQALCR